MRLKGVLGQERALRRLEAELAAGRLAHAYLFVGPAGVGRATTARALFAAANCAQPQGEQPCGQCDSCRRLVSGTHEDLMVLAPPSAAASAQIKVDEVRQVIRTLGFAPFGGGVRLVLIREAEQLNPSSANALLKTLEEPPPNNILVLTVRDPAQLLPTLVSRCRKVGFSPLPEDLIRQELEGRGLEPQEARLRAALSAGSLGAALTLDQKELERRLEQWRRQMAGSHGPLADWEFAEDLVRDFRGERLDRQGLVQALELLGLHFRDQAVAAAGRPGLALLPQSGAGGTIAQAAECFSQVRRSQSQILGNASPELAVAVMLAGLSQTIGHGSNG